MARFLRYKDSYINLNHIVKVELKRGDINFINVIGANSIENILLQIEEEDINKVENLFCSLRSILEAENFNHWTILNK